MAFQVAGSSGSMNAEMSGSVGEVAEGSGGGGAGGGGGGGGGGSATGSLTASARGIYRR